MSLDFWMGAFIGTMLALGLILLVVGRANKSADRTKELAVKSNERAHDLLEERNKKTDQTNVALSWISRHLDAQRETAAEMMEFLKSANKPADPEIIASVDDLILAAHRKESVIPVQPWGGFPKPRAAAFVLNMNATMVNTMITRGLRIHRKEESR